MALFRRPFERRAVTPQQLFGTGADTWMGDHAPAGVRVDVEAAMSLSAFWACVRLLSSDISTLPGKAFRETGDVRTPLDRQPRWINEPDPYDSSITRQTHFGEVAVSLLTDGNAYTLAEPSIIEAERLSVLPPDHVRKRKVGRFPEYDVRSGAGSVLHTYGPNEIIHTSIFRRPGALTGMNPVRAAAEGIGIGVATQRWVSRFFGQGTIMPGFISVPGDVDQAQIDAMAEGISKRAGGWRKAGLLGFLTGGSTYQSTGLSPKDADLTALRDQITEEMARLFGIPPHLIGSQKPGAVSYASVEQRSIDYVVHTLRHYIEPIEAIYSRLIPGDRRLMAAGSDTYFRFNLAGLLRGDLASRYNAYSQGLLNGFLSIDDVRRFEDMAPVPGGDVYRVQAQMTDINAPPPPPPPPPAVAPAPAGAAQP